MDSQKEYEYLLQKISDPDTSDSARARAVERLQAVVAEMQKEAAGSAKQTQAPPSSSKKIPKDDMDDLMERARRGEDISDDEMNAMQEKMMKQMMSSMGGMGMFMGGGAGMDTKNEPKQKRSSGRGGMDDMMDRAMRGEEMSEREANSMQENMMKQMMSSMGGMGMFMGGMGAGAKGGKGLGDMIAAAMRGEDISESELEKMQEDMTERMKNPVDNMPAGMPDLSNIIPGFAMPNMGPAQAPSAVPDDRRYAVDTGDDEVIKIPIYDKEDEKRVLEWLKNELYAEDYYETVYGPHHDSPLDVINKPVSRFEKYANAQKKG